MEIKGNDSSFRPNDPARPERAVPTGAPQRDSENVSAQRRRLAANQPEIVTDELTQRQLRQLRLANIAADQRADAAGNTERPVPGGGVDSISVSSSAERLAKVEETVRTFESPSRSARLAQLRQAFQEGQLNSSELIQRAAEEILNQS